MQPKQYIVTSGNSPLQIQVDYRVQTTGIVAVPNGAGNYDVAFSRGPINDDAVTPEWIDITGMSGAITTQDATVDAITALKITLNSGTNVVVDVCQTGSIN